MEEIGYTFGPRKCKVDSPKCHAKIRINKKTDRRTFYVKVGTFGYETGRLYNPLSEMSVIDTNESKKRKGLDRYTMKRVNKDVFDLYMKFLKTRNKLYIEFAEREMRSRPTELSEPAKTINRNKEKFLKQSGAVMMTEEAASLPSSHSLPQDRDSYIFKPNG